MPSDDYVLYDMVFCLSADEARRYFPTDDEHICNPTAYAKIRKAWVNEKGACLWWLRSTGSDGNLAAIVDYKGAVHSIGLDVGMKNVSVRPALWVEM